MLTLADMLKIFTYKLPKEIARSYNNMHEYYSWTYLSNFPCIIIVRVGVGGHSPNKQHIFA